MNIVWDFSIQKQLNYGFISLNIAERLTVIERSRILRINCKSESWREKESHTTLRKIQKKGLPQLSLRTYATKYFPCLNIFNTLHTVCFMHVLSIFGIKRICHRAYFFRISY